MMFDLDYLRQLISNGIEESSELEYKAAVALQRDNERVVELTKDVSSFANANGGILIYGISENKVSKHLPDNIDPVNRKAIGKEWLEQILNAKIRPRIHGIKIHVIAMPENEDQVVYVLEIPKGETAHQAENKLYYRRHNFMVEPLFDYEIRDIMGRQKNPRINVNFDIVKQSSFKPGTAFTPGMREYERSSYWLNIYAENVGNVYAKYVNLILTIPKRCMRGNTYDPRNQSIEEIKAENTIRDLVAPNAGWHYEGPIAKPKQYGPARYEPVLPGMRMLLTSIPINDSSTESGNNISWRVYADNMEPKSGETEFCNIG